MATKYAFAQGLKELRFHLCQTSEHSAAARSFLMRTYPTMKKHNPQTPILIREALDVQPKVWARYEYGKEKMVPLQGLDDKTIESKVTELVQSTILDRILGHILGCIFNQGLLNDIHSKAFVPAQRQENKVACAWEAIQRRNLSAESSEVVNTRARLGAV